MKKYYNPQTQKNQDLFETLNPVFTVCCTTPNIVIGDKGSAVYIVVDAQTEHEAIKKALLNHEFTKHIRMKELNIEKHLEAYKPTGLYVIGKVTYYEGDPRL